MFDAKFSAGGWAAPGGKKLTAGAVERLNADFADLLADGQMALSGALPEEKNEPEIAELPRLVLTPHRRNFGRFRKLIDAINRPD